MTDSQVATHRDQSRQANVDLRAIFEKKCPNVALRTDIYKVMYRSKSMGSSSWISIIHFEQDKVPELQLHAEGDKWWLTSAATVRVGTNILELIDKDPNFEEKLRLQLEKVIQ